MYDSSNIPIALSRIQNEKIKNEENRSGFYRAIVVQNNDPLNIARVRVRIPSFHGANMESTFYITDDDLPWAYPASMNGAGYKMGQYLIPNMGSLVWVSFEAGTENLIYFGGVYCAEPDGNRYIYYDRSTNSGEAVNIIEDDIPGTYNVNKYVLFKSPKGSSIEFDDRDSTENLTIKDASGNEIMLGEKGNYIRTNEPLDANFPYYITYYMKVEDVLEDEIIYDVRYDKIYDNILMEDYVKNPIRGARLLYMDDGKVVGSGIILDRIVASGRTQIATNGLYGTSSGASGEGTDNYNKLKNRPTINEVILEGNLNLPDTPITNLKLESMLK